MTDFRSPSRVPVAREGTASGAACGSAAELPPLGLGFVVTLVVGAVLGAAATVPLIAREISALLQGRAVPEPLFLGYSLTARAEIPTWIAWVVQLGIGGGMLAALPGGLVLEALGRWDPQPGRRSRRATWAGAVIGACFALLSAFPNRTGEIHRSLAGAVPLADTLLLPLAVLAGGAVAGYLSAGWHQLVWKTLWKARTGSAGVSRPA